MSFFNGRTQQFETSQMNEQKPVDRHTDKPIYWFTIWEMAFERGDHEQADQAARELRRLGVDVQYGQPKDSGYAIEMSIEMDGQVIRRRFEAPTAEEAKSLAMWGTPESWKITPESAKASSDS